MRGTSVRVLMLALQVLCTADLSWGDYQFEVFINRYENPDSRRFNGRCCDGRMSPCRDECDNQFFFCLRPIGYVQELGMDLPTAVWECPMGSTMTDVIMNSDLLQFDMDYDATPRSRESNNQLLINPLVFTGTDWPGGFQLATRVDDSDGSPGLEFVDIILAEEQMEVNDRFTSVIAFRGEYGFGFLSLSFRLTCTGFYSGPNCSDYCGVPGCTPERGICSEMGLCECRDGYSGDSCEEGMSPLPEGTTEPTLESTLPSMSSENPTGATEGMEDQRNTTSQSVSGSNTAIIGSAVGVSILVLLLLVLVLGIGIVVIKKRGKSQQGLHNNSEHDVPSENPTYTGAEGRHVTMLLNTKEGLDLYHKLQNPLYNTASGDQGPIYSRPFEAGQGSDARSLAAQHQYDYIETNQSIRVSPSLEEDDRDFEGSHYELIP